MGGSVEGCGVGLGEDFGACVQDLEEGGAVGGVGLLGKVAVGDVAGAAVDDYSGTDSGSGGGEGMGFF